MALSTPERVWWLPDARDFESANGNGFREVLPNMTGAKLWSSTYVEPESAVRFRVDDGRLTQVHWQHVFSGRARCVGEALPRCAELDLRQVAVGTRCRTVDTAFQLVARDDHAREIWRDFKRGSHWSDRLDRSFAPSELGAAGASCAALSGQVDGLRFRFPSDPVKDLPTLAAFRTVFPNAADTYMVGSEIDLYAVDLNNEMGGLTRIRAGSGAPETSYAVRCLGFRQISGLENDI